MPLAMEADRDWVNQNLIWLHKCCLDPWNSVRSIDFTLDQFPHTFGSAQPTAEVMLDDLCALLTLPRERMAVEFFEDVRDIKNMPLEIHGLPPSSDLVVDEGKDGKRYRVQIATAIREHPRLVLKHCILEACQIVAHECAMDTAGEDNAQVKELFAVYLGFGTVLARGRVEVLYKHDGLWEEKVRYGSALPMPMFAYALALNGRIGQFSDGDLLRPLPNEVKEEVKVALAWMAGSGADDPDLSRFEREYGIMELQRTADMHLARYEYDLAIEYYRKVLFTSEDPSEKAIMHNNIGYAHCCVGQFEKSLKSFETALSMEPEFAYAMDNMGFALIMMGELETGKTYLDHAFRTPGNHPGYSHRNLALYYWKKGDRSNAGKHFDQAFQGHGEVDFLDFFVANFLIEDRKLDEARPHAERAASRNEPGAVELLAGIDELIANR